jgi:hypothetical protein
MRQKLKLNIFVVPPTTPGIILQGWKQWHKIIKAIPRPSIEKCLCVLRNGKIVLARKKGFWLFERKIVIKFSTTRDITCVLLPHSRLARTPFFYCFFIPFSCLRLFKSDSDYLVGVEWEIWDSQAVEVITKENLCHFSLE